jgi:hypothetical protein
VTQDGQSKSGLKPLIEAGVLAPGAKLFTTYKGQRHEATVDADGHIHLADGSVHQKPSGAAVAIAGHRTNGWRFWKTTLGDRTVDLADLRPQALQPEQEDLPEDLPEQAI